MFSWGESGILAASSHYAPNRSPHHPSHPDHRGSQGASRLSDGDKNHSAGWYLSSVATFMIPAGIQMVLLPYLLAIELHQPAARYGVTQMFGQLPMLLLLLFGGWLADRIDPRKILINVHVAAILMPLALVALLWRNQLTETALMLYAVAW